ncbi:MAG: PorV/PorQ family protein [Candidatus Marinimicrobia bacterium]|nr:PorV/PorQ family protein [Candidatus Neomarinimicrobiota bacterium]
MLVVKKNHLKSALILLLSVFSVSLFSQTGEETYADPTYTEAVSNVGTSAAAFLEIGVGAYSQAMGGAFTAIANDVTALYWNPAGITQLNNISLSVNHTQWLASTSHDYFGAVIPFSGRFSAGLSINVLNYTDKQPVRTIQLPDGTGEYYAASDMALAATLAATITDKFSFGITTKYILQQLWHESAHAMAIDVGVLYKTRIEGLQIGTTIANYGSEMQMSGRDLRRAYDADEAHYSNDRLNIMLETDQFPLPLLFRFGLAYSLSMLNGHNLTFATDLNHPSNSVESLDLGLEWDFRQLLVARVGYNSLFDDSSENGLSVGFGITPKLGNSMRVGFNYAWSEWGLLGNVQRFSIDLLF